MKEQVDYARMADGSVDEVHRDWEGRLLKIVSRGETYPGRPEAGPMEPDEWVRWRMQAALA